MNSEKSKNSEAHMLRHSLGQNDLQRGDSCVALSNLGICYTGRV